MSLETFTTTSEAYISDDAIVAEVLPNTNNNTTVLEINSFPANNEFTYLMIKTPSILKGDGTITKVEFIFGAVTIAVQAGESYQIDFSKGNQGVGEESFDETTLTFNNRPTISTTPTISFDITMESPAGNTVPSDIDISDFWDLLDWDAPSNVIAITFKHDSAAVQQLLTWGSSEAVLAADRSKIRITFTATIPDRVTSLNITQPDPVSSDVNLNWGSYDAEPDVIEYRIYRSTTAYFDITGATLITTVVGINDKDFLDTTTDFGITYFYTVVPVDDATNFFDDGLQTTTFTVAAAEISFFPGIQQIAFDIFGNDLFSVLTSETSLITSSQTGFSWTTVSSGLFKNFQLHFRSGDLGIQNFEPVIAEIGEFIENFIPASQPATIEATAGVLFPGGQADVAPGENMSVKFGTNGLTAETQDSWVSFVVTTDIANAGAESIEFYIRANTEDLSLATDYVKFVWFSNGAAGLEFKTATTSEVNISSFTLPTFTGGALALHFVKLYVIGDRIGIIVENPGSGVVEVSEFKDNANLGDISGTVGVLSTLTTATVEIIVIEAHFNDVGQANDDLLHSAIITISDISQVDPLLDTFPNGIRCEYELRIEGLSGTFSIADIITATTLPVPAVTIEEIIPAFVSSDFQLIVNYLPLRATDDFTGFNIEARYEEESDTDPTISSTLGFTVTDPTLRTGTITGLDEHSHYKVVLFVVDKIDSSIFRNSLEDT